MIPLRPYQNDALSKLADEFRQGKRAPLLVAPTGSGKTVMLSHVVHGHLAKGGSVNWYAHRRELVDQASDTLRACGLDVGDKVRVLSVQGALASGEIPECSLAVFDEAHHFSDAAEEWARLTAAHKNAFIVGATATPERGDGSPLNPPFDSLVVAAQVPELIKLGHLVPVDMIRPARKLKPGKLAQSPVVAYQKFAAGHRAVVFAQHVEAAKLFQDEFEAANIDARVIHGKTPAFLRANTLELFRGGSLPVIINVYVLTEGWDCPATSAIILARSIGSASMYMQTIGRGMRPSPGKDKCIVLDLSGCSHTFGPPDQEWEFSLDGEGMKSKVDPIERLCHMCGTPLGLVAVCPDCGKDHSLLMPEITGEKIDRFAWIKKDPDHKRIERLARWIQEGRARGYKLGWALGKYKGVYGEYPPASVRNVAMLGGG